MSLIAAFPYKGSSCGLETVGLESSNDVAAVMEMLRVWHEDVAVPGRGMYIFCDVTDRQVAMIHTQDVHGPEDATVSVYFPAGGVMEFYRVKYILEDGKYSSTSICQIKSAA